MATLTETEIIGIIYNLYETDDTGWDSTSSEYVSARAIINVGLNYWKTKTTWRDLFTNLTAAQDGTKTTTQGVWSYACPTNFSYLCSWVRTVSNGSTTFWKVLAPEMFAKHANDVGKFCYVTGSVKGGYYINFNPKETLTTGHTINYEYYSTPTPYTATTITSEIPDPYFLVYFCLAQLLKNDGENYDHEQRLADELMSQMETNNMVTYWDMSNQIEQTMDNSAGFGN